MRRETILAGLSLLMWTGVPAGELPAPSVNVEGGNVVIKWDGTGSLLRSGTDGSISGTPVATESPFSEGLGEGLFYQVTYEALQFRVVDTNQLSAYDDAGDELDPLPEAGEPYSGQDAAYVHNPPAYTDNGDGTVTDLVTGLIWQQIPPEAFYSWPEAQAYADSLSLAGNDDWRLPTMKELLSLADFNGSSRPEIDLPYIDTGFFTIYDPQAVTTFVPTAASSTKRTIDGQFWSSDAYVGRTINNDSASFGFNFIDGRIKGYPNGLESGPTGTAFVRCVRGNPAYGQNNFISSGEGTVIDLSTGLMWLENDSGAYPEAGTHGDGTLNWTEALEWAEGLEASGYSDWRLPNAKELQSIVDYTRAPDANDPEKQSAAIDPIFNVTEEESWYWTSTSLGDDLFEWAMYVCFGRALAVDPNTGEPSINAHGAGAMRSDPKTGLPGDYVGETGGHGPQNDQVRVYNYARPVRTLLTPADLAGATPSNILLIIVDDWGIDSSDLYNNDPGASFPPMENLSALATRGLLFENAYTHPTCSPTRASMLTGRLPNRTGIGFPVQGDEALAESEITLPDLFSTSNSPYATAAFGKWHLSSGRPANIADTPNTLGGWPHFVGALGGGVPSYSDWTKVTNGSIQQNVTTYPTTDTVDELLDWTQAQGNSPWFAWVAFNAAHTPFHNPPESLHSYTGIPEEPIGSDRRPAYEAALEALDTEVGRLLSSIDLTNTFIILLGDNGTPPGVVQPPFETTKAKGTLYEGGVHVPMIIAGPTVNRPGRTSALVHCVDIFATILDIAGIDTADYLPESHIIDSVSLLPVWEKGTTVRTSVVSESFGTTADINGTTVRDDRYKLIQTVENGAELYDLLLDPTEEDNLLLGTLNDDLQARYEGLVALIP